MTFSRKVLICFLLIVFTLSLIAGCTPADTESASDGETFTWVKDESKLVDVKIVDNEVQLYYSLCFDNRYDNSFWVSSVTGGFTRFDCWRWIKYKKAFVAETEDGNNGTLIPPNTKTSVIFVFRGEYLGGKIKKNIRIDTLVFALRDEAPVSTD